MKSKTLMVMGALLAAAVLFFTWTPRASAQAVYGSVFGTITDPSGAAVSGAKIIVTDQNSE